MARRLWARFEVLPFRYGAGVGIVAAVVATLVIVGIVTLSSEPQKKEAAPRPVSSGPAEAAVPPAPTWGGYVPPRQARSTTAVVSPPPTQAAKPTTPRSHPARPSVRPSPTSSCPATLKKTKWGWVYQMCKRKQSG
jgi:hypothetical protein